MVRQLLCLSTADASTDFGMFIAFWANEGFSFLNVSVPAKNRTILIFVYSE